MKHWKYYGSIVFLFLAILFIVSSFAYLPFSLLPMSLLFMFSVALYQDYRELPKQKF